MITSSQAPRRGEIWYVFTPGQPDDPHQPRPGLVISENVRNRRTDDLIVVPIFSAGRPGPTRLAIPAGMGGLPRDSLLFCDELTTIDRDFLARGPLGSTVPPELMDKALRAVRRALGELVP